MCYTNNIHYNHTHMFKTDYNDINWISGNILLTVSGFFFSFLCNLYFTMQNFGPLCPLILAPEGSLELHFARLPLKELPPHKQTDGILV